MQQRLSIHYGHPHSYNSVRQQCETAYVSETSAGVPRGTATHIIPGYTVRIIVQSTRTPEGGTPRQSLKGDRLHTVGIVIVVASVDAQS